LTKRNIIESTATRTQRRLIASFGLNGVRQKAETEKEARFTALLHHITPLLLKRSYFELRKDAAVGVDEETWHEYYQDHINRLDNLHERVHKGSYHAQPVRRTYIKKEDGKQRPLGIAALEDKIVQQAVYIVLNHIYEKDFMGFSYGFRPERNQHNALDALYVGITKRKINWILDADIKGFFDNLNHDHLLKFLEKRIGDKRILRLIRKWLKTGYIEKGKIYPQDIGTPQGSVISPMLANVFLHYALDEWIAWWRKNKAKGDVIVVRYADDFVVGFQYYAEAEQFLAALKSRLNEYGLTLHPQKTRLIEFGIYAQQNRDKRGMGKPETFDFLGFTHLCGKNKKGGFMLRRKTIKKRFIKKCKEIKHELIKRMHDSIKDTGKWLRAVIVGHGNYFGVPGNMNMVKEFYTQCVRAWLRTLRRRSHKAQNLDWKRFNRYTQWLLKRPRLAHPFPDLRLDVKTRSRSRMR
jgi:RNA-directed DNA polymerase